MCVELGNETGMENYVLEAGNTFLCNVNTLSGCSEKENEYITTWKSKEKSEIAKQITRLAEMNLTKMKPDLADWNRKRSRILNQLITLGSDVESEL